MLDTSDFSDILNHPVRSLIKVVLEHRNDNRVFQVSDEDEVFVGKKQHPIESMI